MNDMIAALIPPLVLALVIVMIASCQPAQAGCFPVSPPEPCEDNVAIAANLQDASTPDIVKVMAVTLFVGTIVKDWRKKEVRDKFSFLSGERSDNLFKLLPDHKITFTLINHPLPIW